MDWVKKNAIVFLSSILSCYGLYLRYMTLKNRELWFDETHQFDCMQGAFKPFWLHNNYGDFSTFPGEYVLNYVFVHGIGMNKWGLAIPHILVTIIGFWLLYKVGRYYFCSWVGYVVVFAIMAFNQELVFHSFEFRPYAVLPVLALGSLYCAHRITDQSRDWGKMRTFLTGLFALLAVNYHAYGIMIFCLPFLFIALLHWRKNASFPVSQKGFLNNRVSRGERRVLMSFVLVALLLWGWYASHNYWGMASNLAVQKLRDIFQYISNPVEDGLSFFKTIMCVLVGCRALYVLWISVLVAPFLPGGKRFEQFVFASVLIILPITLILNLDLRSHYWFLQRQFVWVMPFAGIFLGWQWDNIYCFIRPKQAK